jgi:hypothetical protein
MASLLKAVVIFRWKRMARGGVCRYSLGRTPGVSRKPWRAAYELKMMSCLKYDREMIAINEICTGCPSFFCVDRSRTDVSNQITGDDLQSKNPKKLRRGQGVVIFDEAYRNWALFSAFPWRNFATRGFKAVIVTLGASPQLGNTLA